MYWTEYIFLIMPGMHELKWSLQKSNNPNTAWLDDILLEDMQVLGDEDFETNDGTRSTINEFVFSCVNRPFLQMMRKTTNCFLPGQPVAGFQGKGLG